MAKLYVLSGDDVGRTYELTGDQAILGRGTEADLVVRGLSVSRKHARVERVGSGWRLVDLGSSNGIRLSGMRLPEGELVDGETFHLGDVELRFRADGEGPAPITPVEVVADKSEEESRPQAAPPPAAPVEEEFDLEGDWDAEAPLEVQPVRSAPQPRPQQKPRSAPAQGAKASAARRAEALGGARAEAGPQATAGSRPLQYHKVENRSGLLGADLDQQGSTTRWLLYGLVVLIFCALAYGAYSFTTATKRTEAQLQEQPE